MISNPLFLISLFISASISFFLMAFVIESILTLFKIKHARMRYILRSLPFLSLLTELTMSHLSLGYWLNPLNCDSCLQNLLLTLFFPNLKLFLSTNDISLKTYISAKISHPLFSIATLSFFAITLYFISRRLIEGFTLVRMLLSMHQSENKCKRPIENATLHSTLQKHHIKIFSSDKITMPMATYPKAIFIPIEIVQDFPQQEFEAIIAHELEHLLWKDQIGKFFTQLVSSFFWWLPTYSWHHKMAFEQEVACDESIKKYRFKEEFLASALVKVATFAKGKPHNTLCYFTFEKHPALKRIKIMLNLESIQSDQWEWKSYAFVIVSSIVGLLCMLL